ncbi:MULTISPECIES: hypothetical protein [Inquilinus]|uniref:Sel1 repeat family protein n=1 Tax=Inquilinus ginsengisoli TaxID=363840 RepID=A0ABU1JP53_9PROT|nr:hypothetical protein [Inquilinus ginsengisoli]MDR6289324.1 hypothetical protein [Inquilinus ginsengisoli]
MDVAALRRSLADDRPPASLTPPLAALWWDAKGDWAKAHGCVDSEDGSDAAWAHAYLHRKEGDLGNAGYWYRRAGRPVSALSLDQEWAEIAAGLPAA